MGRAVLQQHWFYARDPSGIGPGSFIRLGSLPWQVVLVSEDDPKYLGIALDKPWPMKQEEPEASTVPTPRDYAQTLGSEYFATLTQSDTGFGAAPPSGMGSWGTFARVQVRAMRIGIEKADRCWDLSSVLSRLLDRFHANPKHKKTGYLADCEAGHWSPLDGRSQDSSAVRFAAAQRTLNHRRHGYCLLQPFSTSKPPF
jgi:hypothetical protein